MVNLTAVLDGYPQKDDNRLGWYEKNAARMLGQFVSAWHGRHLNSQKFTQQIMSEVVRLRDIPDKELPAIADYITMQMRHDGSHVRTMPLALALVARTMPAEYACTQKQLLLACNMFEGCLVTVNQQEYRTRLLVITAGLAVLAGMPVHMVTTSDARSNELSDLLRSVYKRLEFTIGTVNVDQDDSQRRQAYACNIVCVSQQELAMDYMRDRLKLGKVNGRLQLAIESLYSDTPTVDKVVMRGLVFALIDDADRLMVDNAMAPVAISRPGDRSARSQVCEQAISIARSLDPVSDMGILNDQLTLTDAGTEKMARVVKTYPPLWKSTKFREKYVTCALFAMYVLRQDQDYAIIDGKIRFMRPIELPDQADKMLDIQQMLEMLHDCELSVEPEILSRMSFQRLFRRYHHIAGVTGSINGISSIFRNIYGLSFLQAEKKHRPKLNVRNVSVFAETNTMLGMLADSLMQTSVPAGATQYVLMQNQNIMRKLFTMLCERDMKDIVAVAGMPRESMSNKKILLTTNPADVTGNVQSHGQNGNDLLVVGLPGNRRIYNKVFSHNNENAVGAQCMFSIDDEVVTQALPDFLLPRLARLSGHHNLLSMLIRYCYWQLDRHIYQTCDNLIKVDEYYDRMLAFSGGNE
jgi:preprotein translocase subunit SecA